MTRLTSLCCAFTLIAGCGTSRSEPDAQGTVQPAADTQIARIHIKGFQKSKSGAT